MERTIHKFNIKLSHGFRFNWLSHCSGCSVLELQFILLNRSDTGCAEIMQINLQLKFTITFPLSLSMLVFVFSSDLHGGSLLVFFVSSQQNSIIINVNVPDILSVLPQNVIIIPTRIYSPNRFEPLLHTRALRIRSLINERSGEIKRNKCTWYPPMVIDKFLLEWFDEH